MSCSSTRCPRHPSASSRRRIFVTNSRTTSSLRPELVAVASSLPPAVAQDEVAGFTASLFAELGEARVQSVFDHTAIDQRHLARPLDWYADRQSLGVRFRI